MLTMLITLSAATDLTIEGLIKADLTALFGNVTIHKNDYPTSGQCGETSMSARDAAFPVRFGGFKNGGCSDDGYTEAAGTKNECSPTVLGKQWCMQFKLYSKPSLHDANCSYYHTIGHDGSCADACWGAKVGSKGICPASFMTKYGGFSNASCRSLAYTIDGGSQTVPAGPCGTITVEKWTKTAQVEEARTLDGNVTIHKDEYPQAGQCGQTSMSARDATFPVRFGGFKSGVCAADGYAKTAGSKQECSPTVLGKRWCMDFELFSK